MVYHKEGVLYSSEVFIGNSTWYLVLYIHILCNVIYNNKSNL